MSRPKISPSGEVSEIRDLLICILDWWDERRYDEYGGGDGDCPYNVYNEPPECVQIAQRLAAQIEPDLLEVE